MVINVFKNCTEVLLFVEVDGLIQTEQFLSIVNEKVINFQTFSGDDHAD